MASEPLKPGKDLENTIKIIDHAMKYAGVPYWLCFGGLWALIRNGGVVPDSDLDICTYYGADYQKIAKVFESSPGHYVLTKALVSNTNPDMALYCAFNSTQRLPHICLSFWYPHGGNSFYCHDTRKEVTGTGAPKSGYDFRGMPTALIEDNFFNFWMVEWPGVDQMAKIRAPRRHVGAILDYIYPDWAFKKQRYVVTPGKVEEDKMVSYHRGGALSPISVHVGSMKEFENPVIISRELKKATESYDKQLKQRR